MKMLGRILDKHPRKGDHDRMNKLFLIHAAVLLLASCGGGTVATVEKSTVEQPGSTSLALPLTDINLAEIGALTPKGRVQDREYNQSPVVEGLIAHGKESIPYLISKLDDETKVAAHVVDYWYDVRIGDVALIILTDLFTDSTWQKTTISGVEWDKFLERGNDTNLTGEQVLRNYISRHGRTRIKERWQHIWEANKNEILWDEKERCFKV
jgi:hypothetical protein